MVSSEHDTVWERERSVTGARNRSPDHRPLGQRERKGKEKERKEKESNNKQQYNLLNNAIDDNDDEMTMK